MLGSLIDSAHWSAPSGSVVNTWLLNDLTAASRELPDGSCVNHAEALTGSELEPAHLFAIPE